MTTRSTALEAHPYSYPYETGGVSCMTCGGSPGAAQHDPVTWDASGLPGEIAADPARPRIRIYLSGYSQRQVVMLALELAALAGAVMGDIWLAGHL